MIPKPTQETFFYIRIVVRVQDCGTLASQYRILAIESEEISQVARRGCSKWTESPRMEWNDGQSFRRTLSRPAAHVERLSLHSHDERESLEQAGIFVDPCEGSVVPNIIITYLGFPYF